MITDELFPVGSVPGGQYAMWWPTKSDLSFANSEARQNISRVYAAAHGYETYIFTVFIEILQICIQDEVDSLYALPADLMVIYLRGPENRLVAFSASQEKGLRLHFHTADTPVVYRTMLWQQFAEFIEEVRSDLEGKVQKQVREDCPLTWWRLCEYTILEMEIKGERVESIGSIDL